MKYAIAPVSAKDRIHLLMAAMVTLESKTNTPTDTPSVVDPLLYPLDETVFNSLGELGQEIDVVDFNLETYGGIGTAKIAFLEDAPATLELIHRAIMADLRAAMADLFELEAIANTISGALKHTRTNFNL